MSWEGLSNAHMGKIGTKCKSRLRRIGFIDGRSRRVCRPANLYGRATRGRSLDFNNGTEHMAGFARCSRCNHVLTSLHVEAVPVLGALPAGSRVLVAACPNPNCRAVLGTAIIGPARTDARSRFHRASLAKTHDRRQSVGGTVRRLLEDEER